MSYNKRPNLDSSFDDDDGEIPPAKKSKVRQSEDEDLDLLSSSDVETDESFANNDPDYTPDTSSDSADTTKESEVSVIVVEEKKTGEKDRTAAASGKEKKVEQDFLEKIGELRSKGISLSRAGQADRVLSISKVSELQVSNKTNNNNQTARDPKLTEFAQRVSSYVHGPDCVQSCGLLTEETRDRLALLADGTICSPDFLRGCISLVTCSLKCGDIGQEARRTISLVFNLSKIAGISPLGQTLIWGVKSQAGSLDEAEELELKGMEALKNRHFLTAESFISKALKICPACIRLKLVRADVLVLLGKFSQAERVAGEILERDRSHSGAHFLRAFSLYNMELLDQAVLAFRRTLEFQPQHQTAKILLEQVKVLTEKREAAGKAAGRNKLEEAISLYSQALLVDPANKKVRLGLLVQRGSLLLKQKKAQLGSQDCEAALLIDKNNAEALVLKARCLVESQNFGEAVRILETMNTTDRQAQQKKKHMAEVAARAKKIEEAMRLYEEVIAIDKGNAKYRQLLKEAKQKDHLTSRLDYYALLGVDKTVESSGMKKAYFKKSREYHPDKHASASEAEKEELSLKFKQAKEAYEVLSNTERRKVYDRGTVPTPPGGWYRDTDRRFLANLKRMSEANIVVQNSSLARGGVRPGRGGGRGPPPTVRTGPGITINKVPTNTRGNNRGRRRKT